jgi:hypothetical protein
VTADLQRFAIRWVGSARFEKTVVVDSTAGMEAMTDRWWKLVWASPCTLMALLIGVLALRRGGQIRRVDGVWEIDGPLVCWLLDRLPIANVAAMTVGHAVLGRSAYWLEQTRLHERVHVRQFERWGPLFPFVYWAASLWMHCRGRDFYRDNPFEREAYRIAP